VGAGVEGENTESHEVVQPPRLPLVIRPVRRTYCVLLLSDELMSYCATSTNGCLDLRRLGGQVSAEWSRCPWHDVLETVWLKCDEAQQVGCLRG